MKTNLNNLKPINIDVSQAEKIFLKEVQEILQPTKGTKESIINQAKKNLQFELDPQTGLRRLKTNIADDVDLFTPTLSKILPPVIR
mgnify:CR=1 FL=1